MILIDYNNLLIANVMQNAKASKGDIQEDLLRHMTLNSLRLINTKFKKEYGEIFICAESKSWRKTYFTPYKKNRKKDEDIDWDIVNEMLDKFLKEFDEYLPYHIIQVDEAEGDDVIAVLAKHATSIGEKSMVVSNDKDFIQLISPYVSLWAKTKDIIYTYSTKQPEVEQDYI